MPRPKKIVEIVEETQEDRPTLSFDLKPYAHEALSVEGSGQLPIDLIHSISCQVGRFTLTDGALVTQEGARWLVEIDGESLVLTKD